jgi:hypothetical protein
MKGGEPQSKADFVNSLSMLQSQLSAHVSSTVEFFDATVEFALKWN